MCCPWPVCPLSVSRRNAWTNLDRSWTHGQKCALLTVWSDSSTPASLSWTDWNRLRGAGALSLRPCQTKHLVRGPRGHGPALWSGRSVPTTSCVFYWRKGTTLSVTFDSSAWDQHDVWTRAEVWAMGRIWEWELLRLWSVVCSDLLLVFVCQVMEVESVQRLVRLWNWAPVCSDPLL